MKIEEMPAGREMDALVAERVMGIKNPCRCDPEFDYTNDECNRCGGVFIDDYSFDIVASWNVLLETIKNINCGGSICFTNHFPDIYGIDVRFDTMDAVNADELPLAICRAALLAVGVKDAPSP